MYNNLFLPCHRCGNKFPREMLRLLPEVDEYLSACADADKPDPEPLHKAMLECDYLTDKIYGSFCPRCLENMQRDRNLAQLRLLALIFEDN